MTTQDTARFQPATEAAGHTSDVCSAEVRVPRSAGSLMQVEEPALPFNPQPKPTKEGRKESERKRKAGGFYGPEWPKARAAALARDEYRCVKCRSREGLEVHHVTHVGFKGRDDAKHALDNLLSLCWRHHAQAEDGTIERAELEALLRYANAGGAAAEEWPLGLDEALSPTNGRAE